MNIEMGFPSQGLTFGNSIGPSPITSVPHIEEGTAATAMCARVEGKPSPLAEEDDKFKVEKLEVLPDSSSSLKSSPDSSHVPCTFAATRVACGDDLTET